MKRRDVLAAAAAMGFVGVAPASRAHDTVDVLVVGAGGAGLSAACHAAKAGASVLVLEKEDAVAATP